MLPIAYATVVVALFVVLTIESLPPYREIDQFERAKRKTGLVSPLGPNAKVASNWTTSLAALLSWIGLAIAITLLRFSRQNRNFAATPHPSTRSS